ncbi:MAG: alpha-hydroxy-acid oxidizing protein [Acidobacteriia bacterium]|nr:alpha-hydroxy-acid oxidizing protein [Terriglobia bacterium]
MYRRKFLEFVAGSPLMGLAQQAAGPIQDPKDALNVMDFEAAARKAMPPAHFGYMATGVDGDATLRENHAAYGRIGLRPRRLVDVTKADTSVEIFGEKWDYPLAISPIGNMKAFHPDAELEAARGARARKTRQILSTVTTTPIEAVVKEGGNPIWFQLYASPAWEVTVKLVRRAEAAGCPVIALTVDTSAGRNTETAERSRRVDTRECAACHEPGGFYRRKSMYDGIDMKGVMPGNAGMSWDIIARLRDVTRARLVLKGIVTAEDAALCVRYGVDGIIVSNHGGRAEESGRATIDCLPEVAEAVNGRIPVMVDGGIRRGTDIFKALALGARAVCVGRPYLWGVGAFGRAGVERVLEILQREFTLAMKQCGARSLREISPAMVLR